MKTILDIPTRAGRGTLPGGIVLRDKGPGEHCRYVTHAYNVEDERRSYFWGHYHDKLSDALVDMGERVAKAERYGEEGGGLAEAA